MASEKGEYLRLFMRHFIKEQNLGTIKTRRK